MHDIAFLSVRGHLYRGPNDLFMVNHSLDYYNTDMRSPVLSGRGHLYRSPNDLFIVKGLNQGVISTVLFRTTFIRTIKFNLLLSLFIVSILLITINTDMRSPVLSGRGHLY